MGRPSTRETEDGTLRLSASQGSSLCTLALSGELDMSNAPSVSDELARIEAAGTSVTIDLADLEFIDSTGIAILVEAHQRLGGRLRLVRSRCPGVERVLVLTGLDRRLPFA